MRRVIIESPYKGDVDKNLDYLRACMRDCIERGEAPYASHALYTQPGVLDDTNPAERERGMLAGFAWMAQADVVAVYKDHGISSGMLRGINSAKDLDIPIEYRSLYQGLQGIQAIRKALQEGKALPCDVVHGTTFFEGYFLFFQNGDWEHRYGPEGFSDVVAKYHIDDFRATLQWEEPRGTHVDAVYPAAFTTLEECAREGLKAPVIVKNFNGSSCKWVYVGNDGRMDWDEQSVDLVQAIERARKGDYALYQNMDGFLVLVAGPEDL